MKTQKKTISALASAILTTGAIGSYLWFGAGRLSADQWCDQKLGQCAANCGDIDCISDWACDGTQSDGFSSCGCYHGGSCPEG
jgi:hypothetical protein